MRKSDKNIENRIIKALTHVCESIKHDTKGFKWISHEVNYQKFPESLKVTCCFKSTRDIQELDDQISENIYQLIQHSLSSENIILKDVYRQVNFDVQ